MTEDTFKGIFETFSGTIKNIVITFLANFVEMEKSLKFPKIMLFFHFDTHFPLISPIFSHLASLERGGPAWGWGGHRAAGVVARGGRKKKGER